MKENTEQNVFVDKDYVEINLDLHDKDYANHVVESYTLIQGNHNSRVIRCYLTKGGGFIPIDLNNSILTMYIKKADLTLVMLQGKVIDAENGIVDFTLTKQALAIANKITCMVVKVGADKSVMSFPSFTLDVTQTIVDENLVESTNDFSAWSDLLGEVAKWEGKFTGKYSELDKKLDVEITKTKEHLSELANKIVSDELDTTLDTINKLYATKAEIGDLIASTLVIEDLKSQVANIDKLITNKVDVADLEAVNTIINSLKVSVAEIDNLVAGSILAEIIQAGSISSDLLNVKDGFIKDAMISSLSASKIDTGVINTNNVNITSENGGMLLQGNLLQFKDKSGKVRIQIGQDTQGNYTFTLYDSTGEGVLINERGVQSSNAIKDGLIVDSKVSEDANISGSKLNISSLYDSMNADGSKTLKASKVHLDDKGQTLDVSFKEMTTKQDGLENTMNTAITDISVSKGQISQLIQDTTITTANGTTTLKDAYNHTKSTVDSHSTTIGNMESTINAQTGEIQSVKSETASIKAGLGKIELDIKTNYETKTEATNKVNNAISESKGYTDSQIQVTKDAINLGVSQTYETKDVVESKITTSKSEAIASANSYADIKKQEAIGVASTDATNKVNNAKNELASTIDSKANKVDVYTKTETYTREEADGRIKLSKEAIELGVSQKYETIENVNKQVTSTLDSAQSYADDKKNEAINSANATLSLTIANYYTKKDTDSAIKLEREKIELGVSQNYETKSNVTSQVTSSLNDAKAYANDKKNEAITSANNTLTTTIANYYTKQDTDSRIKVAKEEIELGVKTNYETKEEVDKKIENIKIGGRNLAQKTSSIYSSPFTGFNGNNNICPSLAKVLTDGLSVGDTVTVRLIYKYNNVVPVSGQTAQCWIQGSGNVTAWNIGQFGQSPRKTINGSGEVEFLYNFKVVSEHLKNAYWDTNIRHDYVQSGSIQFKMFKVEKGTIPTDWSYAIEDMENSYTIILSNEAQVIPTNSSRVPTSSVTYYTDIQVYKGTSLRTDYSIGNINSANGITVSKTNTRINFSVSNNTALTSDSGAFTIPISIDGKTFNKTFSWSVSKQGQSGTNGTNGANGTNGKDAQYVIINGEQVFKYTNNFTGNPTPSSITLTATKFNTTNEGRWQYKSTSGVWINWTVNGVVQTGTTLTVPHTAFNLATQKTMTIRYLVGTFYDEITIVKVSDGTNGVNGVDGKSVVEIKEMYYLSTSQQTLINGSWVNSAPRWEQGKFIWTKTKFVYSDGSSIDTTPICVTGKDGADGLNGGVSVSNVDTFYYQSDSPIELVGGEWNTNAPTWVSGKYIWMKTITYLDNNTQIDSDAICISGEKGQDGKDGKDGIDGVSGVDGVSTYFYVRYSTNANGNPMTSVPNSNSKYMGVCSTILTTAPTDYRAYTWTLIKGADGQNGSNGANGADGKSSYLHIKYSNDGGKTFTSNNGEDLGAWIGTYVDFTLADSMDVKKYTWSKFIGDDGTDARQVIVNGEQVFTYNNNFSGNPINTSITLSAKLIGTSGCQWSYRTSSQTTPTNISGANGLTLNVAHNASYWGSNKQLVFRCTSGDVYDEISIVKISSGTNGVNGQNGTNGINGQDAYTVFLTNESHIFPATNKGEISTDTVTSTKVVAYKGSQKVTPSISTLPSVTGLTISKGSVVNNELPITITAKAGLSLAYSGTFDLVVTVDGKSFTKTFSWSKSLQGANGLNGQNGKDGVDGVDGQDGQDGKGVTSIIEEYYLSTSMTSLANGSWSTTVPTASRGKYIWTRSVIRYTDGTSTTSKAICVSGDDGVNGTNGVNGQDGVSITKVDVEYAHSSSHSTAPTSGWATTAPQWVSGKYIWERTKVYYSNGTTTTTQPACITGQKGQDGTNGKGIKAITEYYLVSTTNTGVTSSTSGWSTSVPTLTSTNRYLWNYETVTYTDNSVISTTPKVIGVYGDKGQDGTNGSDGNGIKSIVNHYLATNSNSGVTTSTNGWTTTIQAISPTKKYLWNYEKVSYTNGTVYNSTPCIIGAYGDKGQDGTNGTNGQDAITIVLSNETHTFPCESNGNIPTALTTSCVVTAYKGATTVTPTIGNITNPNGMTITKNGSTLNIQANVGTSLADNGVVNIPITVDGKTFTKTFSWTKAKKGMNGANGQNAKTVDIVATSQVFKSTDGGLTFSPDTITLTPKFQSVNYSNWQYSTNGGSTWNNVTSGQNGLTISGSNLTISKSSSLYTQAITAITFRVNTNDSSVYDVMTIVKLYDVADLDIGGRNMLEKTDIDKYGLGNWIQNSGTLSVDSSKLYAGRKSIKVVGNAGIQYNGYIKLARNTTYTYSMMIYSNIDIPMSGNFPVHMWVNTSESTGHLEIIKSKSHTTIPANTWTKVWIIFSTPNVVDTYYMRPFLHGIGNATVNICQPMLEKGNKASDWNEAPEDIHNSIETSKTETKEYTDSQIRVTKEQIELDVRTNYETKTDSTSKFNNSVSESKKYTDSQITVAKNEINLGVSQTYETKSNVESKVNTSLDTAKSYADQKKNEAISTASNDATSKVNNAKNELNTAINKKANSSDVYTKNEVYTQAQTNSQIKIATDAIDLNVKNTYETKTEVINKINNIQVGSRNLIKKSDFMVQATSSAFASGKDVALIDGLNLNETFLGKTATFSYFVHCVGSKTNGSGDLGKRFGIHGSVQWKNSSTGVTTTHYPFADCLSGSYKNTRVSMTYTFTPPSGYDSIASFTFAFQPFAKPSPDNKEVWKIGQPKLEIGNKSSDWSPAPEDITNSISNAKQEAINSASSDATNKVNAVKNELNSAISNKANVIDVYNKTQTYTREETDNRIKIAKDSIELGVSKTYETKTNVESKVTTTLSSAKSYADTKKTEAINTASNDATSKANGALSNAKSYADTKKQEAIDSASTDATNKMNGVKNELNSAIGAKANKVDVYTKTETYTRDETDNRIKIAKDAIELGVKNTYETKTEVTNKVNTAIDGIQIGTQNLIKQTKTLSETNKGDWKISGTGAEGFKKLEIVTTNSNWQECQIPLYTEINSLTSKVTVSFEYYETTPNLLVFNFGVYNANGTTRLKELDNTLVNGKFKVLSTYGTWKRVSYTFDPTSLRSVANATHYRVQFKKNYGHTGTVYVRKPKLEVGTTTSNWTPAPEDTELLVSNTKNEVKQYTDSQIQIAKNAITQSVSSMYETKSDATNKINGVNSSISSLTNRVASAESKITEDAITNTVKKNFYTKEQTEGQITSKGYATSSEVKQTTDALLMKFSSSGGYNLIRNSGFLKEFTYWGTQAHNNPSGGQISSLGSTDTWGFPNVKVRTAQIKLSNQSSMEYGLKCSVSTTIGKTYTIRFRYSAHRINQANVVVRNSGGGWHTNKYFTPSSYGGGNGSSINWGTFTHSFIANNTSHVLNIVITNASNDGYLWIAEPMVFEGEVDSPYSPHPDEIYQGQTAIDESGIRVNASNVGTYTQMSADGFYVKLNNGNKLFEATNKISLYDGKGMSCVDIINDPNANYGNARIDVRGGINFIHKPGQDTGLNQILLGNHDVSNQYGMHNMSIRCWNSFGFQDHAGLTNMFLDIRRGRIIMKGALYQNTATPPSMFSMNFDGEDEVYNSGFTRAMAVDSIMNLKTGVYVDNEGECCSAIYGGHDELVTTEYVDEDGITTKHLNIEALNASLVVTCQEQQKQIEEQQEQIDSLQQELAEIKQMLSQILK